MMRDFKREDLDLIDANKFSDIELYIDFLDALNLKTMEKDGKVVCIIGYLNYWGNNYKCFVVMCEGFKWAREAKKHIHGLIEEHGMERVETESPDDEVLNRWHEFIGFKKEGTKVNFMNNQDYNVWSILKGDF